MIDTKVLREKILDLAIRGKLVPQDPNDEPASVLLKKIREQKKQMVKEDKLKAKDIKNDTVIFKGDDNLHYEQFADGTVKCIEDEIPFEVPDGWAWCRFVTICPYGEAEKVETNTISDDEWILDLEDIEKNTGKILYYATKKERNAVSTKHRFFQGQLLYSKLRPYLNKVVIAPKDGYCTSEILPLKLYGNISPQYIQIFLMSPTFLAHVNMLSYGVKMPRLGTDDGKQVLIALPPLNEQHSIVERYMEAIPFVEKLESTCNDFSTQIDLVKSKILDLAIHGKLVPQNPEDEPASVLLERIRAEKEELIKAGKIKRDKKESVILKGDDNSYYEKVGNEVTCIDGEVLFEIPQGWCYTRLSSISEIIMGSSPNGTSINRNGNGMEFHQGKICFTDKIIGHSISFTDKSVKLAKENSLLLCVRAPVGEVNITDRCVCIGRGLAAISPLSKMQTEFLFYWLQSFKKVLLQKATGSTFVAITADTVKNICIPLPPLEEQNRICKAIDKIFVVLDIIEQSLN